MIRFAGLSTALDLLLDGKRIDKRTKLYRSMKMLFEGDALALFEDEEGRTVTVSVNRRHWNSRNKERRDKYRGMVLKVAQRCAKDSLQ